LLSFFFFITFFSSTLFDDTFSLVGLESDALISVGLFGFVFFTTLVLLSFSDPDSVLYFLPS